MATKTYDFKEQLLSSQNADELSGLFNHIVSITPQATGIIKSTEDEDRNGTDYWLIRPGLPPISVDLKIRSFCPIEKYGKDDACIETCSVYTGEGEPYLDKFRKKPGWSVDINKRTDWILYVWPNKSLFRYWIVYFPWLCKVSRINYRKWIRLYREREAKNNGYITLSVYPPRSVIKEEIDKLLSSQVEIR